MEFFRYLAIFVTLAYGLWYPSFSMYKYRAFEKVPLILDTLKYFVVIIFFYGVTTCLDIIMGGSSIYNLLKLVVVWYLGTGHYKGAKKIYSSIFLPLATGNGGERPFIMKFAMESSNENFAVSTQHLFAHLVSIFQQEYESIYGEIDFSE